MKILFALSLVLFGLTAHSQQHDTVYITKHDTVVITYVITYDTTPMNILYYGSHGTMKHERGYTIRQKRVNWQHPEQQEVIWQRLYDRHYTLYNKEFYQANQAKK